MPDAAIFLLSLCAFLFSLFVLNKRNVIEIGILEVNRADEPIAFLIVNVTCALGLAIAVWVLFITI